MAEERIVFSIDLDTKEASVKVSDLKKGLSEVGKESMSGATDGLKQIAVLAAEAYAGFKVFQTVWDALFEADRLKAIETSFQQLTKTFGISTDALRDGLEKASNGLIDTTDLLNIANRSMVSMGAEAQRLPEIMELARKASVITGQDVATTFEGLSNAIATGNQRALKQMGIVVDLDKAVRDYSKSLGYNADVLSDAGKRHAVMNEVLDKGNRALSGISDNVTQNTNTWLQLKNTLNDLRETFVLLFEKVAGPVVRRFMDQFKEATVVVKNFFMEFNGDEAEKTEAKIFNIKERINTLQAAIARLTAGESSAAKISDWFAGFVPGMTTSSEKANEFRKEIELLQAELKGLEQQSKATASAASSALPTTTPAFQESMIDPEKKKNAEKQFQKDLLQIQKTASDEKMLIATNDEMVEEAMQYKRVLLAMQTQEQIRLIQENDNLNKAMKDEQTLLAYEALQARLQDLANETANEQSNAAERAAVRAETAFDKIAAGARRANLKARAEMRQFATAGETAFSTFQNTLVSGFQNIGAGSEKLSQVMLKALLLPLADYAAVEGKFHLLKGLWPPNPVELGMGAGLLALSGVIRGLAGGGGSPATGGGGAGGGGFGTPADIQSPYPRTATDDGSARPSVEASAAPRKSVTLVVQGNYFETEQTRTKITEMIREASDATDFKILSVGGEV
jgi:hypothetical protein